MVQTWLEVLALFVSNGDGVESDQMVQYVRGIQSRVFILAMKVPTKICGRTYGQTWIVVSMDRHRSCDRLRQRNNVLLLYPYG